MSAKSQALRDFMKEKNPSVNELTIEIEVERKSLAVIFRNEPDGSRALKHLEEIFGGDTVGYDLNGAVDPNATLVKNGQRQVLDYIKECIEDAS